ncbi:MAG: TolC family protein [Cyclobacteriaceae bacterium]|nr:TolC family protein [Cyclobacteriaceae bacterium]
MNLKSLLIGLCGLVSFFSFGQENLSLSDAIRLGLQRNYDIRIEEKTIAISEKNNSWGEAGLFPSLTTSLQGSTNVFDNKESLNPFQIVAQTKTTQQYVPALNLNWNLLGVKNIFIAKHRFETLQRESMGNADVVIANTIQSIILGYYIAVLEKKRTEEFKKQLKLSNDKYDLVKLKSELGSAVTTDLLLEEGNYLTDSANYINQHLAFKNAMFNFNFLIGETETNTLYNLTDDLTDDVEELTFEGLTNRLNQSNIDLKKQYLSQAIINDDVQLSKANRLPQLTIGANYNYTTNTQDVTDWPVSRREIRDPSTGAVVDVLDIGNNRNVRYGANFTVSFNLYNGGKINRAIQRTIIQEDIGNIRIEKLKASLNRDLVKTFEQYRVRKQLYEISDLRYVSATKNLEISTEKYNGGTISSFDYRTVQNNQLTAATQRLQSLYNLIDSKVSLMRLTGGIIETYKQ